MGDELRMIEAEGLPFCLEIPGPERGQTQHDSEFSGPQRVEQHGGSFQLHDKGVEASCRS